MLDDNNERSSTDLSIPNKVGEVEAFAKAEAAAKHGDLGLMEVYLKEAIALGSTNVHAYLNLARYSFQQQDRKAALKYARDAYKIDSSSKESRTFLLHALLDSGLVDEALEIIKSGLESNSTDRELELAQVACFRHKRQWTLAKELADGLIARYPNDPAIIRLMGDVIGEQDSHGSLPYYTRAINLSERKKKRADHTARWNLSLHLLRSRQFKLGWKFYESGLTRDVGHMGRSVNPLLLNYKRVDLSTFKNTDKQWIFSCVEQGIGDQVLFLSVLDEALREFEKIVLCAEDRLIPIIARSFPQVKTVYPGIIEYLSSYQFPFAGFVPLGSFMGRYRTTETDFINNRKPYLKVSRSKYEKYRSMLRDEAKGLPIVGISWRGGFWESQQGNKSIQLSDWVPILRRKAFFVSLQYGDVAKEVSEMENTGFKIRRFANLDFKRDLDDWLALSAACDGVVSVSTALVHFAGAAGQKVALLMPESQGPWIHGLTDERSIVYPNVHVYRRLSHESIGDFLERGASVIQE